MKNIKIRDIETKRLILKIPTMIEQETLWNIVKKEEVNRFYFPTPDRIFNKYNLSKDKIKDLLEARKIFQTQLNDWNRQKTFYEKKIESIYNEENNNKFIGVYF